MEQQITDSILLLQQFLDDCITDGSTHKRGSGKKKSLNNGNGEYISQLTFNYYNKSLILFFTMFSRYLIIDPQFLVKLPVTSNYLKFHTKISQSLSMSYGYKVVLRMWEGLSNCPLLCR